MYFENHKSFETEDSSYAKNGFVAIPNLLGSKCMSVRMYVCEQDYPQNTTRYRDKDW